MQWVFKDSNLGGSVLRARGRDLGSAVLAPLERLADFLVRLCESNLLQLLQVQGSIT